MLFFLTGNPQTGKTRWLLRQIDQLAQAGVECCGVVAPGTWIEHDGEFEKTGIDNLLLPERHLIPFARRRDLAQAEATFDENSQAARAKLGWAISDDAIGQANAHLKHLFDRSENHELTKWDAAAATKTAVTASTAKPAATAAAAAVSTAEPAATAAASPASTEAATAPAPSAMQARLLVIDEFGILELERGEGLTEGVALVDRGATPSLPHALVVVRSQLVEVAERRFANAPWNGKSRLSPGDDAAASLALAIGVK